jgi:hypothetical protein
VDKNPEMPQFNGSKCNFRNLSSSKAVLAEARVRQVAKRFSLRSGRRGARRAKIRVCPASTVQRCDQTKIWCVDSESPSPFSLTNNIKRKDRLRKIWVVVKASSRRWRGRFSGVSFTLARELQDVTRDRMVRPIRSNVGYMNTSYLQDYTKRSNRDVRYTSA